MAAPVIPAFVHVRNPGDVQDLNRMQDNLAATLGPMVLCALLQGRLLTGVVLANGANNVAHGLGRAPLGAIVVLQDVANALWASASATPSTFIVIHATTAVVASLWVF